MQLVSKHIEIIGECLRAAAYGPFFPAWEFPALFGLDRTEVAAVADEWPVELIDHDILLTAINNTFNSLLFYPLKNKDDWDEFISVNREELASIYKIWRQTRALRSTANYFDGLM